MSPSTAPNVKRPTRLDRRRLFAGHLLPPLAKWSTLPPDHQAVVSAYLMGILGDAREGFEAAEAMAAINPDAPGVMGQKTYWLNVASALIWALKRVGHKHRYLTLNHPETVPLETEPTP